MSLQITCPNCQGTMEAREELLGSQARCPFCLKVIKVEKCTGEKTSKDDAATAGVSGDGAKPALPFHVTRLPAVAPPSRLKEPPEAPIPTDSTPCAETPPLPRGARGEDGPVGLVLGTPEHRQKRSRLRTLLTSLMQRGNPTDASVLLTAGIAAILTVLVYVVIIHPLRGSYIGDLLAERGWVPYVTVFLSLWAATILLVKFWKLSSQQAALTYDLLPPDPAVKIQPGNIDLVQNHIRKLPVDQGECFLVNRVLLALDYFKARKNVQDVGALLNSQSDIDSSAVESSYAMLKVLIWAIPILGFIGTVVGISDAVAGFTQAIQAAQELDVIKTALAQVTAGLAVAFDTTLVALVLSVIIMFPTNSLQKAEENLLSKVDQYGNENLLPRLSLASAEIPASDLHPVVPKVFLDYQATLMEWQKRLESLELALFEKVMNGLEDIRKLHEAPSLPTRNKKGEGEPQADRKLTMSS